MCISINITAIHFNHVNTTSRHHIDTKLTLHSQIYPELFRVPTNDKQLFSVERQKTLSRSFH